MNDSMNSVVDGPDRPDELSFPLPSIQRARGRPSAVEDREIPTADANLRRLLAIYQNCHDGLMLLNDAGNLVDVNPSACEILGYRRADLLARRLLDRAPAASRRELIGIFGELIRTGIVTGEHSLRRPDGSIAIIDYRAVAEIQPGLHLAVIRDVTAYRLALDRLGRQARLLEVSHDSIMVRHLNGMIAYWNRGAENCYGWTCQEAFGQIAHELLRTRFPAPLAEIEAILLREGYWEGELVHTRSDGRRVVVSSRWVLQRDDHGFPQSVLATANDITAQKQTEERLRRSEAMLADAQRLARIGSWNCNLEDGTITWSREHYRIFEVDPAREQLTIDFLLSRFHPDDRDHVRECVTRTVKELESVECSARIVLDDGSIRIVQMRAKAVRDEAGELSGLNGTAQDVTERRQAETALGRYAERLRILRQIDRAILEADAPDESARAALERLGHIVPFWRSCVTLFDFDRCEVVIFAAGGEWENEPASGTRIPFARFDEATLGELQNHSVFRWTRSETNGQENTAAEFPDARVQSYVRVPLWNKGRLLGSLNACSENPNAFDREQIDVIREVADWLAIAIWQSSLFVELRDAHESLADLSRRLIRAEEDERRRIAGELHDEIGQGLTALKLNLRAISRGNTASEMLNRVDDSIVLVDGAIVQLRSLSLALRPALLDDLGLIPALRSYVSGVARRSGIEVSFAADESLGRQDTEIETACYRIAQEALNNVVKHSGASRIAVVVKCSESEFRLLISDDGVGFDFQSALCRSKGGDSFGLLGMRERAALVGGRVEVVSSPGAGTLVSSTFPFERPAPQPVGGET